MFNYLSIMNNKNKFLTVAFISVISNYANAAEWELINKTPEASFYIDSSFTSNGKQSKGGDLRKVRTLADYNSEQTNVHGKKFMSMEFIDEMSCAKRTTTTLSSVQYQGKNGTGKIVSSHKMNVRLTHPIIPGTANEMVLGEANCNLITGKWGS